MSINKVLDSEIFKHESYSANQKLIILIGKHLSRMDVTAQYLADNPKVALETFKTFQEKKRLKEISEREVRLKNKLIKTKK